MVIVLEIGSGKNEGEPEKTNSRGRLIKGLRIDCAINTLRLGGPGQE